MRGGARNLTNDWREDDLDDLQDFVPVSPKSHNPDTLDEVYMRKSNHKKIDRARADRRASKERLNEADEDERASA